MPEGRIPLSRREQEFVQNTPLDIIALFNSPNYVELIDAIKKGLTDGNEMTELLQKQLDALDTVKQMITDIKKGRIDWGDLDKAN